MLLKCGLFWCSFHGVPYLVDDKNKAVVDISTNRGSFKTSVDTVCMAAPRYYVKSIWINGFPTWGPRPPWWAVEVLKVGRQISKKKQQKTLPHRKCCVWNIWVLYIKWKVRKCTFIIQKKKLISCSYMEIWADKQPWCTKKHYIVVGLSCFQIFV